MNLKRVGSCRALLMASLSIACAEAQAPTTVAVLSGPLARRLHDTLEARKAQGFRGVVVLEQAGQLVLSAGYGWADSARRIALTPRTVLPTGSLTKQFTAMAVIDLWRRGLLRFTDAVGTYLGHHGPAADQVTVHQLLTHTSGMAEYCGPDFALATRDEFLSRCLAQPLLTIPGSTWAYSNPGYGVLAAVVEEVSGQTIEDYLTEHFFTPLGMTHTGYTLPDLNPDSVGVIYVAGVPRESANVVLGQMAGAFWNVKGNGGIQSSPMDMLTWYRAIASGPVISDAMRAVALQPHARRPSGDVSYGYGWNIRLDANGRLIQVSHTGADGSFAAVFVWKPVDGVFLYLVGLDSEPLAFAVTRALLGVIAESPSP